ncbi:GIN domain-containing protein [Mucilaginibacter antarcticus]|uniref:GIN domain-containing protein n=1 Tax=Mucilaginibacter antarcticus TaxID=1855725 RepID=A0ABW5XMD0_9SPHI
MKTRIVTLITLATIALSVSVAKASTITNNTDSNSSVPVTVAVNNISKIEASGNVEVYITNGDKDGVKVYDKYFSKNALVQGKDGVLRISSYTKDKLVVLVTVTDLRNITADDNAIIKSYGRLSAIDLNVVLNNNASAQLKLDAFAANFTVNSRATVNLSGSINDYTMNSSQSSTVNKTELVAVNVTENNTTKEAARRLAAQSVASL